MSGQVGSVSVGNQFGSYQIRAVSVVNWVGSLWVGSGGNELGRSMKESYDYKKIGLTS